MLSRRTFILRAGALAFVPRFLRAQPASGGTIFYAGVGATLSHYALDPAAATLTKRGQIKLPANIQYAWPHRNRSILYVASSETVVGPGARNGNAHFLEAYRIDATGALTPHGERIVLPARPIHVSTDIPSEYALVAFNNPSALRVFKIKTDGSLGAEIAQTTALDCGIYAHQVRVAPNNRFVVLVSRGNDATPDHAEDPGALHVFRYEQGKLSQEVSIAPRGGFGFGPRHVDFHPTKPWLYVSRERESALSLFRIENDRVQPEPAFTKSTLAGPSATKQMAGTVHLHPNGRFVYGVNRLDLAAITPGTPLTATGDNSLVVFAVDQTTGEPTAIQNIETGGIHDRTFQIDPTGRILVSAHIRTLEVRDRSTVRSVPAGFTVFRVGGDGRLEFVRKYDLDTGNDQLFWSGMVTLPA